jgi:hypothetical protein
VTRSATVTSLRTAGLVVLLLALFAPSGRAAATPTIPSGVYRTTITDADLRAGHATGDIAQNHGTFTLTIHGSRWSLAQTAPNAIRQPNATGGFSRHGSTFVFEQGTPAELAGLTFALEVTRLSSGLEFLVVRAPVPEIRVIFGAHVWRRIG